MIGLVIELVIAGGIVGGWLLAVVWATRIDGRKRIEECRRNIDRLERELFPEWFPSTPTDPAVAWKIEMHKRALLGSAFDQKYGSAPREIDWISDAPAIWQSEISLMLMGK